MKIQYILTFDKGNQKFGMLDVPIMFATKQAAVDKFKKVGRTRGRHLLKVSMCANAAADSLPAWFLKANGKLWDDDLGTVEHNPYRKEQAIAVPAEIQRAYDKLATKAKKGKR